MVPVKIWMEISKERLAGNFAALQRIAADAGADDADRSLVQAPAMTLLAVIKANAYGHGIVPCAAILAGAGAEWLGVTDATEGVVVRGALAGAGIAEPQQPGILVMCGTAAVPGEAERIVRHRLTPVVWSIDHLKALARAAGEAGLSSRLEVHLEIDTGMSRQGVVPGRDLEFVLRAIASEPRLTMSGVFTHFASTEVAHSAQTVSQQASFEAALDQIAVAAVSPRWVHAGNSSYIDNSCASALQLRRLRSLTARVGARSMVRSGLALFGYVLPITNEDESEDRCQASRVGPNILPVMTWKTRVIGVSEIVAGAVVGYNGTFRAERPMRLALLPVGYADGLRRELSSSDAKAGGWVMVRGRRAPIVGRVSMNLTTVDVSVIDGVREGDEAVLLGDGITADDHARLAGTIAYEILCGIRADATVVA